MKITINKLGELFDQCSNKTKAYWLVANQNNVIYASPDAEDKLGLLQGMQVMKHPLINKAFESKKKMVENYQTLQNGLLVNTTVTALPIKPEDTDDSYVLLYGVENFSVAEKTERVTTLIQEINRQTSTEAALKIFVQGCLELFECQMAAIWVMRAERYHLLAKSAENSQGERFFGELSIIDEFSCKSVEGLISVLSNQVETSSKHVLGFPLQHLGEELGILVLFAWKSRSFDHSTTLCLNQLGPLAASLVHEYELRLVASEREKDLNLLLWGTEILVQVQSESELLEEAGEMAMVLNLEAGFFFMRQEDGWKIQAPFGRLKQKDTGWEQWIFNQIQLDQQNYLGHEGTYVSVLTPSTDDLERKFPWCQLLIQPVETNNGIIGEFWLLDFEDTKLEKRIEIFAAFGRSLGLALETIRQRQKLELMATTDSLTGILNRQGFSQRFRAEMAATLRRDSACLFLILDLDGFKKLNDTHGHPTGDRALAAITRNINACIRENDILARSGGDEFTLVLTDMQKGPDAIRFINRLKERMGLEEFELGVSIGVAEFPTEADSYEKLYHLADERLYIGKHNGKNRVIFE